MSLKQVVAAYLARKADALVGTDAAFFEQTLHPQFTYVNTRGSKLNKPQYIAQFANAGGVRFAAQVARDVEITTFGDAVVATMTVMDTFERSGVQSSHEFQSLCVYLIAGSDCRWVAGQTMVAVRT
jgi:hypothetical protein